MFQQMPINQWFDLWLVTALTDRGYLQIDGLCETSAYIYGLLQKEIGLVGSKNVILGGLSQRCAAVLVSLLTWQGEPIAGAVGMCGWLPCWGHIENIIRNGKVYDEWAPMCDGEDDFGLFSHSDDETNDGDDDSRLVLPSR
jgi:hypothetical protein